MKYIVVTGGVVSGLGKGITISSIGRVLKASGLRVTSIKIDPYLNVDAGTMSPFEHGETFVLNDGGETDLDLGNYERFLDVTLTARHNITSGKIFSEVIKQERRGDYLGKTVQIVPHATDTVQAWIEQVAQISVDGTGQTPEVCLIEVGGTVGDIESMVFLEALRQFQFKVGRDNILFVHVSLVPVLGTAGEQKTKPTQHSVKELRALGLSPDLIVCRSTEMLTESTKSKISVFCHVSTDHIVAVHDVSNLYHVPLMLMRQNIHGLIQSHLKIANMLPAPDLSEWSTMAHLVDNLKGRVEIAIVGKYNGQSDSYLSVIKALKHSAILLQCDVDIVWIDSSDLEEGVKCSNPEKYSEAWTAIRKVSGVLIPGGFGARGVEGKIAAAHYARTNKIPCLGVCLGLQVMVIEFARHVLHWDKANSTEFDSSTPHPVVIFMPEGSTSEMGGTMRLGARATIVSRGSVAADVYGFSKQSDCCGEWSVLERHRHRYEVNPANVKQLEEGGLVFSGRCDQGVRMEMVELPFATHPFYFGAQCHPELLSKPDRASPPFFAFVALSCGQGNKLSLAGELRLSHEKLIQSEIKKLESPQPENSKKRGIEISSASANKSSKLAVDVSASPQAVNGKNDINVCVSPFRSSSTNKAAEMILPKPLKFDV